MNATRHGRIVWRIMLILFSYLVWTGRQCDNFGRASWKEAHVMLAVATIAGIGFRLYFRRAGVQNTTRASNLLILLLIVFFFTGSVTEGLLMTFAVGLDNVKRQMNQHLPAETYRLMPLLLMILFASVANFDPIFVASALTIMVLTGHRFLYGNEGTTGDEHGSSSHRFPSVQNLIVTLIWFFVSPYYLYGQMVNALPTCLSEPICTNYPYEWLQLRCQITCALTIANADLLFDIALVVFAFTAVRICDLLGSLSQSLHQEKPA